MGPSLRNHSSIDNGVTGGNSLSVQVKVGDRLLEVTFLQCEVMNIFKKLSSAGSHKLPSTNDRSI